MKEKTEWLKQKSSLLNKKKINSNAQKFKKTQKELTNKALFKFIQGQIDKIRNLFEDRELRIA